MPEPRDLTEGVEAIIAGVLPQDVAAVPGHGPRRYGLDSLSITRLWFLLRKEYGVDLGMKWLGECEDAAPIAERIAAAMPAPQATPAETTAAGTTAAAEPREGSPAAGPADPAAAFPLTDIQQAYVVGRDPGLTDDPIGCHVYREFTVADADAGRLSAAWNRTVEFHPTLRTALTADGRQRVRADFAAPPVPVHDRAEATEAEFDRHRAEVRERLAHRRYAAAPGAASDCPLWTVEISRGPRNLAVVHLSVDALIIDGHGLSVLLDDWWHWYREPEWAPSAPPLTAAECVRELAGATGGSPNDAAARAADLAYWRERLAGLPGGPEPVATGAPGPATAQPARTESGCLLRTALSADLSADQYGVVRRLAEEWSVSPTALVLTLFAEAFAAYSDRPFSLVLTTTGRPRLLREAENVVGPFTSSLVMPVPDTLGLPLRAAAGLVHDRLREDLAHAGVSGVAALRALARSGTAAPALPVVFTGMLGTGRPAPQGSFAASVDYAISQTSGVALDHQMWDLDGRLKIRWDVVEDRFPAGAVRLVFARFVNSLYELSDQAADTSAMNELQQAYFVSRASAGAHPWDGCQVYHSFEIDELDTDRLAQAWLRLAQAHAPLRTVIGHDGSLAARPSAPEHREIPVVDLTPLPAEERARFAAGWRDAMAGRAFPLGRGPHSDIRVTIEDAAASIVHLTTDLTILDGRSIHFVVRELMRLYADPEAEPRLSAASGGSAVTPRERVRRGEALASDPRRAQWTAHWRDRVAGLHPGPLPAPKQDAGPAARIRREGHTIGWNSVRERAAAAGVTPDDLLAAALTEVLGGHRHGGTPFSITVVRWTGESAALRPGEFTALSWLTADDDQSPDLWARAARFRAVLDADASADGVRGLVELRKRVMRERHSRPLELPVVYTGILDLTEQPLPDGVRLGPWLTCTPDVVLDCVSMAEGDSLHFYWDTMAGLLPAETWDRLFAEYAALISSLCDDTEPVRIAEAAKDYGDLDPGQRELILRGWNDTAREVPFDRPVHSLFEQQVEQRPEQVALRWTGGAMTYRELGEAADRIAAELRSRGVGPGTAVGISVPRGPFLAATVFGVLKAGGFYVPLEPSLPAQRAGRMLAAAQVGVVLVTAGREGWAVPEGVTAVTVDRLPEAQPAPPGSGHPVAGLDDLAYVIYTSGSTGEPKGVAVTHRPLLNLLNWCYRSYGFGPGDVGLCVTSLGFDLSVFDLVGLLGCGATLYLADDAERHDPRAMLRILVEEGITFWNSAPTALAQLAPFFPSRLGEPGADSLRLVFLSGDYTPLTLPEQVRGLFRRARLVSLGGATEATVWSNWFEIGHVAAHWRSIPYGRPIDNCRYHILDERMRPCAPEVEGDLYIGGVCLAQGYFRQPGLTEERFIPDPFGPPGERLYRTGDRASYFPDGTICFRGRADRQVKVRGFRVEPAEIEFQLRRCAGVEDVAVVPRRDASGDVKLVAYVITPPGSGDAPSVARVREYAAGVLPAYMVPNVVVFIDGFPATANGKLDWSALPWPAEPGSTHVLTPAAPRRAPRAEVRSTSQPAETPATADLAALVTEIGGIFADLLGVGTLDPDADLWDQGATSFTMVQVSAALQERGGRSVPVSALLDEPTVTGIARTVLGAAPAAETAAAPAPAALDPAPVPVPAPAHPTAPESVDLLSAQELQRFKQARWGLRSRRPYESVVELRDTAFPVEALRSRATRRTFEAGAVSADALRGLLGLLREVEVDGVPRRLYPSAGETYAVQVYVHVHRDGVDGLPEGWYYQHPAEHALHLINAAPRLDRTAHFFYNRPVFDQAGFGLYLFGARDAIEPVYGEDGQRFMLLEAGYLGQMLMANQEAHGVGLCPVGNVALGPLRDELGLDDRHTYLQAFLGGGLIPQPAQSFTPAAQPAVEPVAAGLPAIAVVGAAGRFPGADGLDSLWRMLSAGESAIGTASPVRLGQVDRDGSAVAGGFLADVDSFDSELFHIAPSEAAYQDPQLRLLLHTVWECLENAGYSPASLRDRSARVGVFLGAMWQDYQHVGADRWRAGERAVISGTASEAANRISHFFGFDGPSVAIDTSCSSSLAALHLAVQSLRSGECGAAVVAAANLLTHPYHAELLRDLGLLAEVPGNGAFDLATGWAPGEGVAAVLLRPDPTAVLDRDTRLAVIESTGIGYLPGTTLFGAVDAGRLRHSIEAVIETAGLRPEDVGYVECAAAGAGLADAAEIEALSSVFAQAGGEPVPVGTIKHSIGHLEAAAGLSQLIKVLLQFTDRQLAPTPMSGRPSPLIRWEGTPLQPVRTLTDWHPRTPAAPLRALINAVGATGSYGHVVLRSAPPPTATASAAATDGVPQVAVLSAHTSDRLTVMAGTMAAHLDELSRRPGAPTPADIAFTLQTGRTPLRHRIAVIGTTLTELSAGFRAAARGERAPGLLAGADEPDRAERPDAATAVGAAADWVAGAQVDWGRFWAENAQPNRIPLPTYAFAASAHRLTVAALPAPEVPRVEADQAAPIPDTSWAQRVQALVIDRYAELSGIPAERLHPHTPLENYGLSSSLITQLSERLEIDLHTSVPKTVFFENRDLAAVSAALADSAAPHAPLESPEPPREEARTGKIAVIGMAGRFPGAPDLDAFWRDLLSGRDAIAPLPAGRHRPGYPNELMIGGFLSEVDVFDPLFFGITPREANLMDPQERLFLEVAWHTLENAGYTPARLREQHADGLVGVYAASMYNEYPFFGITAAGPAEFAAGRWPAAGSAIAGIANRVSYLLDLHGPSMTVDSMCSSSLTAIHLAVAGLRRGEIRAALVGGVNLSMHPDKFVRLDALKMASTDHRCRTFGAGADGFVPGEGVGAVLLKRLEDAERDGDRILAVISGTAVNHGGRTNGYTVPDPSAQAALVTAALRDAHLDPADIGYLEAHGTGTTLGDLVEAEGLRTVFGARPAGSCPVGSVKSNIGHLEGAAGIAGLAKAIMQYEHDTLVPSLHADQLNTEIDWDRSPLRVQRGVAAWPPAADGTPRRTGISSFGAGGSNAHVIVESHDIPDDRPGSAGGPELIVVSARTLEQLREAARRLTGFLTQRQIEGRAPSLADIAHTLQTGRVPMRERLAFVADTVTDVCGALDRFNAAGTVRAGAPEDETRLAGIVRGTAVRDQTVVPPIADADTDERGALLELARQWVRGAQVDWTTRLRRGRTERPRPVDLPGYPFARMRCWIPEPDRAERAEANATPAVTPAATRAEVERDATSGRVPLLTPRWIREPADTAVPAGAGRPALEETIVCLFRPAQRSLALECVGALSPSRVLLVRQEDRAGTGDGGGFAFWDEASAADLAERLADGCGEITGWLDLCALPDPADAENTRAVSPARDERDHGTWGARLAVLQRLLARRPRNGIRALQVTRGLLGMPGPRPDLTGARLAGFVAALGAEHPWVRADVVDVDVPVEQPGRLAEEITRAWGAAAATGRVCVREGERYTPRLQPVRADLEWRPGADSTYLITGATGGLGALVARHLVSRGARRLALLGLRPLPEPLVRELREAGAAIEVHSGPLTDRDVLSGFLDRVRAELGAVEGVFHCAGRSSAGTPGPLSGRGLDAIRQVLEPKGDGLDRLMELLGTDPSFFLLFSSVSSAVPSLGAGIADYAAANAYLDHVAGHHRRRPGGPRVHSVNWPVWRETGGGADRPDACASAGIDALSDAEGLAVLDRVLMSADTSCVLPCPALPGREVDATALLVANSAPRPRAEQQPPALPAPARKSQTPPAETPPAQKPPARRLIALFANTLGIPEEQFDVSATFGELGVESILLAELLTKLEAELDRPVDPTALLEYPTVESLSAHLGAADVAETAVAEPPVAAEPKPRRVAATPPGDTARPDGHLVAVIGMACRFPGAPDTAAFWRLLSEGVPAVTDVPPGRWEVGELYDTGRSVSRWGGFLDAIEDFDPGYFGMSDREATNLDPAVRLMLEVTAAVLADAGYPEDELRGRGIGVFTGARMSQYRRRLGVEGAALGLGGDQNFIAARIAHQYDLRGMNLVVDSACSSGLVAVQLACRALQAGDTEMALAGAVEVLLDEEPYLEFTAARALSPRGRCAAFARDADGFVPGEGAGVLLLKRLDAALRDGDAIHAVINAVAVGNDGHTMGLTTPNPVGQADVVRRALREAGVTPDQIGMVEAHGTATLIGDPLELRALQNVFREQTARTGFCAIGSVKSNIGHLLSAAGIAGLIKTVLSVRHGQIPPTLFCAEPNERFDFAASPFFPNTGLLRRWPAGPRLAGVSAFGLGGTNAHAVVSAFEPAAPARRSPLPAPVFDRRRLWLERTPGEGARQRTAPPAVPLRRPVDHDRFKHDGALVASLLEFR